MNEFRLKINSNSFINLYNFLSSHFLSFKTNGPLKIWGPIIYFLGPIFSRYKYVTSVVGEGVYMDWTNSVDPYDRSNSKNWVGSNNWVVISVVGRKEATWVEPIWTTRSNSRDPIKKLGWGQIIEWIWVSKMKNSHKKLGFGKNIIQPKRFTDPLLL
jgi:hypothetical protein